MRIQLFLGKEITFSLVGLLTENCYINSNPFEILFPVLVLFRSLHSNFLQLLQKHAMKWWRIHWYCHAVATLVALEGSFARFWTLRYFLCLWLVICSCKIKTLNDKFSAVFMCHVRIGYIGAVTLASLQYIISLTIPYWCSINHSHHEYYMV